MRRTTAVAAGAAVIAAIALIAGAISPWYEVASRPVQLTTLAAVDAIDLCWTSDGCERFEHAMKAIVGRSRVAAEQAIEPLLPFPHPRIAAGDDHLAVEDKHGGLGVERHVVLADAFHQLADVRGLHVTVAPDRAPDALAEAVQHQLLARMNDGHLLRQHAKQHDRAMQAAVSLHVVQQCDGRAAGRARTGCV